MAFASRGGGSQEHTNSVTFCVLSSTQRLSERVEMATHARITTTRGFLGFVAHLRGPARDAGFELDSCLGVHSRASEVGFCEASTIYRVLGAIALFNLADI
ncbi:hypothetical protein VNO78_24013 [Psophocarpus tetragonolobus]|uniref:Uncharacterized protein n=1 Tax=Psophocarpus tetragonolobus TaxID=3891 RepID=A0AAN9S7S0_PSOTE